MLISIDRTGFPLLVVEEAGVEVHLLPVTKIQFVDFVNEGKAVSQADYQAMLALNPAASPSHFLDKERERLFVTGVLPREALAFAHWLGDGFDLPTREEWRAVYAALRRVPPPRHQALPELIVGQAGAIVGKVSEQLHIRSMRDFSLMQGGLVEWVQAGVGSEKMMVGLGVPRPEFHPNLWDPISHEIKPIRLDERVPYFGFRLVRRGEWYLSDKENARYVF
ncbi:MAG: SUMF1/EgtB/PvdO family nonheme iron enzyme [Anaerolineae bacterium]|nr:SUMF1/EgtB/PvdO family nonheme iron enzyme [Anaerolineae bacterium]